MDRVAYRLRVICVARFHVDVQLRALRRYVGQHAIVLHLEDVAARLADDRRHLCEHARPVLDFDADRKNAALALQFAHHHVCQQTRIDVAADDGTPSGFDLRVHEVSPQGGRPFVIRAALTVGAMLCWYLAGMLWDVSRQQELDSWQERIDALRPAANASLALRQRLDALTEPFDVASHHQPAAVLAPLLELTRIVPDTARLTELQVNGNSMEIAGLASDASSLITTLEASPRFKDVKFRSPVMRRPESNKERFEISLTLEDPKP